MFRNIFGWLLDVFGRLSDVFGWLSHVFGWLSDGFWLSWTAFRYRRRLLAIVNGVSPTAHTRFCLHFFWREAPKKKA